MAGSVAIRAAREEDRDAFYEVCLRTGDSGQDATGQFDDERLLGLVYVGPYLSLQPELAFALALQEDPTGRAQGYCLGALDTGAFAARCEESWWPGLRAAHPLEVSRRASDQELVDLIHHPPVAPAEVVARYPSHLHVDLLAPLRGRGAGALAIGTQLAAMARLGSPGVHLGVSAANLNAIGFYDRLGFAVVAQVPGTLVMARAL